jgi:hypothetical protein
LTQVTDTVEMALGVLSEGSAKSNDKQAVFADRSRFPAIFDKADAVAAADEALLALLPPLRKQLRLPALCYVHPANQGESHTCPTVTL